MEYTGSLRFDRRSAAASFIPVPVQYYHFKADPLTVRNRSSPGQMVRIILDDRRGLGCRTNGLLEYRDRG